MKTPSSPEPLEQQLENILLPHLQDIRAGHNQKVIDQLLTLIHSQEDKARLDELKNISSKNYERDLGTYDYDGIAEDVFSRIAELEQLIKKEESND